MEIKQEWMDCQLHPKNWQSYEPLIDEGAEYDDSGEIWVLEILGGDPDKKADAGLAIASHLSSLNLPKRQTRNPITFPANYCPLCGCPMKIAKKFLGI